MRDGQTNDDERRTREDRAAQPLDAGRLSFAKMQVCSWWEGNGGKLVANLSKIGSRQKQVPDKQWLHQNTS